MPDLLALPAEILHQIFAWLDPTDLIALPRVSRLIHANVQGNWKLCHDIYLSHLDKPRSSDVDWEQVLHDFIRLQLICDRPQTGDKELELEFVHKTVTQLLANASSLGYTNDNSNTHSASRNADFLRRLFLSDSTRAAFLQRSFLFERVHAERPLPFPSHAEDGAHRRRRQERHQRSAQLHCLYGMPILNIGRLRSTRTYPFACSTVYDMRGHTERTRWGPFRDDGSDRVDWEKVEAIMVVLGYNIQSKRFVSKLFSDVWNTPFSGSWPQSYLYTPKPKLSPEEGMSSLQLSDPYGVSGTWYRVVCFLDYSDFFNYNFPVGNPFPEHLPRPGISVGEAMRILVLKLRVTRVEPPGPEDGQDLPVVHFSGDSRLLDDTWDSNGSSELRGTVRLTKEGEVRWTSSSIYHGQERWKSEGIQVGGVRSARGVLGFWFDSDYDAQGPVGPTAIWKASDSETPYSRIADILPTGFLAYSALAAVDDSDPESEMDYSAEEMDEEDEYDQDMDYIDHDMVAIELPQLLFEAGTALPDSPLGGED